MWHGIVVSTDSAGGVKSNFTDYYPAKCLRPMTLVNNVFKSNTKWFTSDCFFLYLFFFRCSIFGSVIVLLLLLLLSRLLQYFIYLTDGWRASILMSIVSWRRVRYNKYSVIKFHHSVYFNLPSSVMSSIIRGSRGFSFIGSYKLLLLLYILKYIAIELLPCLVNNR